MQNQFNLILIATINDAYIDYLRHFDNRVLFNKSYANQRKYIGVVFKIDDINYFAPLSSPKPKHKKMKNTIDFYKIDDGKLGVVNFNNMIPVPNECVKIYDIENEQNPKYKLLLTSQANYINTNSKFIMNKAKNLYNKIYKFHNTKLRERCCDFKLLEQKCQEYSTYLKQQQEREAEVEPEQDDELGL